MKSVDRFHFIMAIEDECACSHSIADGGNWPIVHWVIWLYSSRFVWCRWGAEEGNTIQEACVATWDLCCVVKNYSQSMLWNSLMFPMNACNITINQKIVWTVRIFSSRSFESRFIATRQRQFPINNSRASAIFRCGAKTRLEGHPFPKTDLQLWSCHSQSIPFTPDACKSKGETNVDETLLARTGRANTQATLPNIIRSPPPAGESSPAARPLTQRVGRKPAGICNKKKKRTNI